MTVDDFIHDFNESYKGETWLGASLMKSMEKISWEEVNTRPEGVKKSIAEILLHIINWRIFVIAKLKENKGFNIKINSEEDWTPIHIESQEEWNHLLERLEETQPVICNLLQTKSRYWFSEITAGKPYTNGYMMRGIIHHDIYHLGQINWLRSNLKNIK